jgi:pSer/pThr/pTyr-binding forkhead associated (FHA) protein
MVVRLGAESLSVGREAANAIACADDAMSRRHATISPTAEGWELADCGSANGTWCEGVRVERQRLALGQTIKVGDTLVVFEETGAAASGRVESTPRPGRKPQPTVRRGRVVLWLLAVLAVGLLVLVILVGVGGWLGMRSARIAREQEATAGRGASAFRRQAARDYRQALASAATPEAARAWREGDDALWPVTRPAVGWAWFFDTSLVCVGGPASGGTVVGFYNPWADVLVVTLWQPDRSQGARLAEAEVVLGEYFRRRGQKPFEARPLWMRRDVYRPAAVGIATAETLRAFEAVFRPTGLSRYSPWRSPWRTMLAGLDDRDRLAANRFAAGLVLADSLATLAPLFRAADQTPGSVRFCLAAAFARARRSGCRALADGASETPAESLRALSALPSGRLAQFKPASFVAGPNRSVLLLTDGESPDLFLGLLIATRGGVSRVARVDLLSFQGFYVSGLRFPGDTP